MKTFQIGQKYTWRFICDSGRTYTCEIVSRTAKTVTFLNEESKIVRRKVWLYENVEHCHVDGNYSMAPILAADSEARA